MVYPDTSFLCSVYRQQAHTPMAVAYREKMTDPLPFTKLLEFEFYQATRLQVWLNSMDQNKGFSQREADQMLLDWETDVARGLNVAVPSDSDLVLSMARDISNRHTSKGGHRTLDVLHVATAIHLGADTFLTFDKRQEALAEIIGLKIPVGLKVP